MKLKAIAGLGILATFGFATPAAAVQAPVVVPLQGLETALPMDAPTVRTGIPIPIPSEPSPLRTRAMQHPDPALELPQTPITSDLPTTVLEAPMPQGFDGEDLGSARVTSGGSPMAAKTPGLAVGRPFALPHGESLGLPELDDPQAAILAPALQGDVSSGLGLAAPSV
ncbi:hypothetical protein [Streptomyces sp. NPDC050738]|uniref:hypothetical protein n=1 Tax=Streptomyces sp. NPDC050738 TaxID=3154744 RepID=UPI00343D5542